MLGAARVDLERRIQRGEMLGEVRSEKRTAQQRATRKVRRVIAASSKRLADRAWSLWRDEDMSSALESALAQAKDSAETAAASLRSEGETMTATLSFLLAELQRQ